MTQSPVEAIARMAADCVLVILAHPDDESLLCGGTIAALSDAGCNVHVVSMTDGAQGRWTSFSRACDLAGATCELLDFPTGSLSVDIALVSQTDTLLREYSPGCVITHSNGRSQSQDHPIVSQAVHLSAMRSNFPRLVLAAEPPFSSPDFQPTVFIEVGDSFDRKLEMIKAHREVLDRPYLSDEYVRTRALWWGQVSGCPGSLVESFELKIWR